jgi:hypothetical protein
MPAGLNDRAEDNWRILLAIADEAGGPWPAKAREAAKVLSSTIDDGDMASAGTLILRDTQMVFHGRGVTSIASHELIEALCELPEAPWSEWRHGKPITGRGLAKLLKPFDVRPRHSRAGSTYDRRAFEDAWSRYLQDEATNSGSSPDDPDSNVTTLTNGKRPRCDNELNDSPPAAEKSHAPYIVRQRNTIESSVFSGLVTGVAVAASVTKKETAAEPRSPEIEEGVI